MKSSAIRLIAILLGANFLIGTLLFQKSPLPQSGRVRKTHNLIKPLGFAAGKETAEHVRRRRLWTVSDRAEVVHKRQKHRGIGAVHNELGDLYLRQGQDKVALEHYQTAYRHFRVHTRRSNRPELQRAVQRAWLVQTRAWRHRRQPCQRHRFNAI